MVVDSDSQVCVDPAADIWDDFLMQNALDSHPETEMDVDPSDYSHGASHMLLLDELSKVTPWSLSQVAEAPPRIRRDPRWYGIVGNEISQSARYWGSLQSPQSMPSAGNNVVCPCPTTLPSGPNLSTDEVAKMIVNAVEKNAAEECEPPPPSCDHTKCNPPLNVGFLSRRFEENENWNRARAAAVAAQVHRRRGFYAVPVEILEMITDYFPVIVPITSSEARGGSLQTWDRHTAFRVLASTCMHLRALLYHRSWETKHVAAERLPALIKPPKEVTCPLPVHLIKTLIVPLADAHVELLRQCLLALPSLRALGIVDDGPIVTATIRTVFKNKPDFPNIKKVTIPVCVHPMLARFPGITELVCYHCPTKQTIIKSFLSSARVSYVKSGNGETESVLKSVSVMGPIGDGLTKLLVEKFPRIRKVCLPQPKETDLRVLRGLKEIVEFEFLLNDGPGPATRCHVDKIRQLSIEILQASECHENCRCEYKCGCAGTGNCEDCKPPKRILRIITSRWTNWEIPCRAVTDAATRVEEIRVSPERVLSTKIM